MSFEAYDKTPGYTLKKHLLLAVMTVNFIILLYISINAEQFGRGYLELQMANDATVLTPEERKYIQLYATKLSRAIPLALGLFQTLFIVGVLLKSTCLTAAYMALLCACITTTLLTAFWSSCIWCTVSLLAAMLYLRDLYILRYNKSVPVEEMC